MIFSSMIELTLSGFRRTPSLLVQDLLLDVVQQLPA